jgi:hypothetical protein
VRVVCIDCGTRSARISRCEGAPARAIQELAGHQDLITTQRYMHLSPAAIEGAIRLLDGAGPAEAGQLVPAGRSLSHGDMLETAQSENGNVLN